MIDIMKKILSVCIIAILSQSSVLAQVLPDPFRFADGSYSTRKADWQRHRKEIISLLEHYEIGSIPPMEGMQIEASIDTGEGRFTSLSVTVTAPNDSSITLKAFIQYPQGMKPAEPCPALIGIANCLPRDLFLDRGCAIIDFDFNTVCHHQQKRGEEPINKLYPDLLENGAYSYWPWGVSRIIDGLESLGPDVTGIDTKHLAISGCSWAGKASLWSGALDERICLVIPQEPGGGGIAAWRVSETLGHVETIGRTDGHWFLENMIRTYGDGNVYTLPVDHHQLAALVAPRALLYFGNTDYEWLADQSGYVSIKAAQKVFKKLGVGDHVGYSISSGHDHCQLPKEEYQYVEAYIDRFLLGKKHIDTVIENAPRYQSVDWQKWCNW